MYNEQENGKKCEELKNNDTTNLIKTEVLTIISSPIWKRVYNIPTRSKLKIRGMKISQTTL